MDSCTIVIVTVLTTLTRRVHFDCFKDTKQVNAFVFSTIICLCVWLPYTLVFANFIKMPVVAYITNGIPCFLIPFLCKVFLFVPKLWSARHERCRKNVKDIKGRAIKSSSNTLSPKISTSQTKLTTEWSLWNEH